MVNKKLFLKLLIGVCLIPAAYASSADPLGTKQTSGEKVVSVNDSTFPIHLYRTDEFVNRSLIPTVFVNNKSVGNLKTGEDLVVNLPKGTHTIDLRGKFPEWAEQFNKTIQVTINDQQQVTYFKLDPVFTGVITPTQAVTEFEFQQVSKFLAKDEVSSLKMKVGTYVSSQN